MPNSAGKLAFPMLLRSHAPPVPWSSRMRPPIRVIVGRTVLWLGLVGGCLLFAVGLEGQVFDLVSSEPYLVPVGSRGNWYDLYLHHLQLPLYNHLTENNSAHHQCLPPPARHPAFHRFFCVVFLPPARRRWRRLSCCSHRCPPNSKSFAIVPSYPGTRPNAVGAPRTTSLRRNVSGYSWSPSNRKSATTTSWNSVGPTGCMPTAPTHVNFIQRCCMLFSPSITSRLRLRSPVGTFPTCVHIATESRCQTTFGGTSPSTYLRNPAVEAVPHNTWSSRFCRSAISLSRRSTVTTWTSPLLTLSRVTATSVLLCDCGKMPTKRGKSAKVCQAEQAAKAAVRRRRPVVLGRECVLRVGRSSATPHRVKVPQVRPTDHGDMAVATGHDTLGIPSPQAGQWE